MPCPTLSIATHSSYLYGPMKALLAAAFAALVFAAPARAEGDFQADVVACQDDDPARAEARIEACIRVIE